MLDCLTPSVRSSTSSQGSMLCCLAVWSSEEQLNRQRSQPPSIQTSPPPPARNWQRLFSQLPAAGTFRPSSTMTWARQRLQVFNERLLHPMELLCTWDQLASSLAGCEQELPSTKLAAVTNRKRKMWWEWERGGETTKARSSSAGGRRHGTRFENIS